VSFSEAAELGELLTADLATLLAERFDAAGPRRAETPEPAAPVTSTEVIGCRRRSPGCSVVRTSSTR
jgi:hypothetical protein